MRGARGKAWREPQSGTYFSNFVAVGPVHSGLSFSPSLSLAIVSEGGITGCKDGIEELCETSAANGACVVESWARARWSAEFLSISARDHLLGDECVIT